ncbi:ASCH domain-containing protein [Paraburkholderia rhizosphaerae]|uniref:Putative transcriptional regulator n=1 Tax=Paraburkholderia rhizosphaerae TaxID=480658 RepID=A0A4R8LGG7_9BURK|nr:ASCH domain-containing protein [Paraburkholderia rhizosphaerae]TDY42232.1 putative transcriptional regulator [Paraburkholderia rhizosphaerae]
MKVLLSIKPEFAEKILLGEKHFEFRKAIPKAPGVKTVVIYATKPVGKVVGEFDIDGVISASPRNLWSRTKEFAGITKQRFNEYFDGREVAHAIKVKDARRYEKPLELPSVLESGVAPQSFCYLT